MDTSLAAMVACITACTMKLMSTLGIDSGGGAGFVRGATTVGAGAAKAGHEEATGEVCCHDYRGECLCESGGDMMLVGGGRLQGSWISQSAACSLRYPQKSSSPSTMGLVGW